jgi:two-component system sensor histidine kinase UhpB
MMKDGDKTREFWSAELECLRQRIPELETAETERKRAEVALRESEERFRTIVEQAVDAIIAHDLDGQILIVNSLACKYTGYSNKELLSMNVLEIDHAIREKDHRKRYWEKLQFDEYVKIETNHTRKDGSSYPAEIQLIKIIFNGKPIILSFGRDITHRKQIEGALRESEEKYRSLVESSDDSIYLVDSNSNYLFLNSRYLSRLGLKKSQALGRSYSEFHSPEETKDFTQKVKKVIKSGKSLSYEYKSKRDNRYFMRTLSPVNVSGEGKPGTITVISKDITDLKKVEEVLREREAFNFALFQYNPVETVIVDCEGRVTGFNLAKINSGDRLPTIGEMMYKDYAGRHEIDMYAELMKCIRSEKIKEFPELKYGDKYLSITISPFSNGALIISEDISIRKRAEELLQKERDTFYSILDKAPYGVMLIEKDRSHSFVNHEFTNITGYTLDDVPTRRDWLHRAFPNQHYRKMVIETWEDDLTQDGAEDKFHKRFKRLFSMVLSVVCNDESVKEIEFARTAMGDGRTIVMLSDITERKRMHNLLESSAKEWRTTFDAINDAVCLFDLEGRIKRCNSAMQMITGKSFTEIANRSCWEVLHDVSRPPERCPIMILRKTRHRKKEIVSRDSHWFNVSVDPIYDESGNLLGGVHIMSDITERIQAEKELHNSREELRNLTSYLQSVREQERSHVAREIHDELAQALTALKMDLAWLSNKLQRDQLPLIEKTHSMSGLINTTIQTVKRISAELRPGILDDLGLVAALEWQADEFQNRTGIKYHITVDPDDITVEQEQSTAIFRIFQETLTNVARHSGASRITVSLKMKKSRLNLMVKDNGKGITKKQIFDSASFGLIGMRERVYPWGGKVNIKGSSGKGTTIVVSIPVKNV